MPVIKRRRRIPWEQDCVDSAAARSQTPNRRACLWSDKFLTICRFWARKIQYRKGSTRQETHSGTAVWLDTVERACEAMHVPCTVYGLLWFLSRLLGHKNANNFAWNRRDNLLCVFSFFSIFSEMFRSFVYVEERRFWWKNPVSSVYFSLLGLWISNLVS